MAVRVDESAAARRTDGQRLGYGADGDRLPVTDRRAVLIHFLLVTLGSADLVELALRSIDKYVDPCTVDLVALPDTTTDPMAHGNAIDFWRIRQKVGVKDSDIVVVMDPDCVILSEWFQREMEQAFTDPKVAIWGAGNQRAWGPRVHASMLAIRGQVFNDYQYTFCAVGSGDWRDTGGRYCQLVSGAEWKLKPVEQHLDWNGISCWRHYDPLALVTDYPLWAHLGGGSHSDIHRMTWKQRYLVPWRRREIRKRERFKKAVLEHLARDTSTPGPSSHRGREVSG